MTTNPLSVEKLDVDFESVYCSALNIPDIIRFMASLYRKCQCGGALMQVAPFSQGLLNA